MDDDQEDVGVIRVSGRYKYPNSLATRYINMLLENQVLEADAQGEIVLRSTPKGARNLRARIGENPRTIVLELHHFSRTTNNSHKSTEVKIYGKEIGMLKEFLEVASNYEFRNSGKVRFAPGAVSSKPEILSSEQVRKLMDKDPELVREFLKTDVRAGDFRAIASWRKSLEEFKSLLTDSDFWEAAVKNQKKHSKEAVWQEFFERNQWIFGYGLSYIFTEGIDENKLEQAISGGTIFESGQRPDATLKTRGAVSALCLAEIKTHETRLTRDSGKNRFFVSHELNDAVSQCQKAIDLAERKYTKAFTAMDAEGYPSSRPIYGCRPRSILVIGNQNEFVGDHGVAEERFRAFEIYRRNLVSPEILTFDELYERARCIVEYESVKIDI